MTRIVTEAEVVSALARVGTSIPVAYYLGTIAHESGFDVESVTVERGGASPTSYGLYQVNVNEQAESGVSGSLLDLDTNTRVFVYLAERNRSTLRSAVGLLDSDPDPWDLGAYLALAHNCGLPAALATLAAYPTGDPTYLGWDEYKARNFLASSRNCGCNGDGTGICRYGDDCLYDPLTGQPLVTRTPGLLLAVSAVFLFFVFAMTHRLTGLPLRS